MYFISHVLVSPVSQADSCDKQHMSDYKAFCWGLKAVPNDFPKLSPMGASKANLAM